ncbi:hypothetical protein HYH02_012392 [Chlamydomonas schloesseri]|uniref:Pherophorin domain-containing protein n=1 Tax=Chlamydomonas schloesseri TaxID=2026947 RepID=A0A835SWG7_9CHLO|nr:hypothetical protein HYH02_012392 [Chlamydomonas schloesseri]|eukprot:KAG2434378.1 hypothetical protein HYH02_012392 [Chlamydomonas schloesseri]
MAPLGRGFVWLQLVVFLTLALTQFTSSNIIKVDPDTQAWKVDRPASNHHKPASSKRHPPSLRSPAGGRRVLHPPPPQQQPGGSSPSAGPSGDRDIPLPADTPSPAASPPPPPALPPALKVVFSLEWNFTGDVDIVVSPPPPANTTISFVQKGCLTCPSTGYGRLTTPKTNARSGPETVEFETPLLGRYSVCALYMTAANITGRVAIPARGVSRAFAATTTGRALNYRACDATEPGYIFSYDLA